MMRRNFSSI